MAEKRDDAGRGGPGVEQLSNPHDAPTRIFDSHFHIIDPRFPLTPNDGYLPDAFTVEDYLKRTEALETLGPGFVGVTQLPAHTPDEQILELASLGVCAVRFNLERGGSEKVEALDSFARRVYELAGWHTELYTDAADLPELGAVLLGLPTVSVDHLGLSRKGFRHLLELAERSVRVKATGFGRIDFNVKKALRDLHAANSQALMKTADTSLRTDLHQVAWTNPLPCSPSPLLPPLKALPCARQKVEPSCSRPFSHPVLTFLYLA